LVSGYLKKIAQHCFGNAAKIPQKPDFLQDARQNSKSRRKISLKIKKNFCQQTISLYF
jgi:hypothetical protein